MVVSKYFAPAVLIAGILGLVQSLTWFVLSLLGVLAYRCVLKTPKEKLYSTSNQFPVALVELYFTGPDCINTNGSDINDAKNISIVLGVDNELDLIQPSTLHGWMASYLALDIIFFFLSASMLVYNNYPNRIKTLYNLVRGWTIVILALCIMDLVLTIEFGLDYQQIQDYITDHHLDSMNWIASVPGALMAIAARGFILWIINALMFFYFLSCVIDWKRLCMPQKKESKAEPDRGLNNPTYLEELQGYRGIPRAASQDSWRSNGYRERAIIPVSQEFRKLRPWEDAVPNRWEDYRSHPNAMEGVTRFSADDMKPLPHKTHQVVWDEPQPKYFRSYGPSHSDAKTRAKELASRSHTERRQREYPLSFDEDHYAPRASKSQHPSNFEHNIKNFERGKANGNGNGNNERKPFGHPVRVMIPPPPPPPPPVMRNNDLYY